MNRVQSCIATCTGLVILWLAWRWGARNNPDYVLPSPASTFAALFELAGSGRLWGPLGWSVGRSLTGLGIAFVIGVCWGALASRSAWFDAITRPWTALLMATPPIVIVVIGMLAFGPNSTVVVLVVATVTLPLLTTTVRDAIKQVDPDLLEMARAFARQRVWIWRHVIAPAVVPPVCSAMTVATGQALRLAVMAELLATTTGLGAAIQRARNNLDTHEVFALALVLALFTLLVELAVLTPLRNRSSTIQHTAT